MKYAFQPIRTFVRQSPLAPGQALAVKIVACVGVAGWAAYFGPSDWPDQQVAEDGDKLPERAARSLFPGLRSIRYRL